MIGANFSNLVDQFRPLEFFLWFPHRDELVRPDIAQPLNGPARPGDLNLLHEGALAQSKVEQISLKIDLQAELNNACGAGAADHSELPGTHSGAG